MTTLKIPREWASNANYSTGLDSGAPTKVDPATPEDGYIRGTAAAPQHVNFELNTHSLAARRALTTALLNFRYLPVEAATAVSDTAEFLAAVQRSETAPVVLAKTGQAWLTGDIERLNLTGVPPSITSNVRCGASDGSRIVILGTGGNGNAYSDDDGGSWTAGGASPPLSDLLWNSTHSRFVGISGTDARYSSNAVAWTSVAASSNSSGGLASLANGNLVLVKTGGAPPVFRVSSDGAATWSDAAGTIANSGSADNGGVVAGVGRTLIYHAVYLNSGASIQVSSSADGSAWGTLATITAPSGTAFDGTFPRLLMCPNTGLLVLAASINTTASRLALWASVNGVDWIGPTYMTPDSGTGSLAIAGGRLFTTRDDMIFGTDGCGY